MTVERIAPAATVPVMAGLKLREGRFTAEVLSGPTTPQIDLTIDGRLVGVAKLQPTDSGLYVLQAPIPREALRDGDIAIVFQDRVSGAGLATYLVSSGYPDAEDLSVALTTLRADFEALKRAFLAEAWQEKLPRTEREILIAEVLEAVERQQLAKDEDGLE